MDFLSFLDFLLFFLRSELELELVAEELDDEERDAVLAVALDAVHDALGVAPDAVGLEAGAEQRYLSGGDTITLTQSAVILEQVIGQFLYNQANPGPAG